MIDKLLQIKPEYVTLVMNCLVLLRYVVTRPIEPGKLLYWLGATILTVGLLFMKG